MTTIHDSYAARANDTLPDTAGLPPRVMDKRLVQLACDLQVSVDDALRRVLEVGLAYFETDTLGERQAQTADIRRELGELTARMDAIGPAVAAMAAVLVHWAASTSGTPATEEELSAELAYHGQGEWAAQMAAAGVLVPAAGAQRAADITLPEVA